MKRSSDIVRGAIALKNVVYLIVFMLVAVGIVGLSYINKDEFPTFEIAQGLVAGVYPGATAEEVEVQLTKPLEDILFSFSEVNRENTYSVSKDGICYIYVDLNIAGTDKKDEVWSKIKLRLDAGRMTLPKGVLAVAVMDSFSDVSAMLIAMESKDKGYGEMLDYADMLGERLRKLQDLASVSVVGGRTEEIAVTVDKERLAMYGISPSSLMLDYQTSGMHIMSGTFNTDYVNSPIHIESQVTSEQEIADRIVYSDPNGNMVRLRDIATVERRMKDPSMYVDYNGNSALIVSVVMRPGKNIVAFGKDVDQVLAEFSAELPDSVSMSKITDQPEVVGNSVTSFLRDLVISILVVIVVMLMLFPMRSALIASSGVPVCTALTLAVMFLTGMELNTVTLAGLIVVLGMIVDDSIITMDGYMDKLGRGMSRMDAATASAKELFMPMFMATFAISAMFFPMMGIITGYLGEFVQYFPWIIAIALGISLAYAMLVVPSMEVRFIKTVHEDKGIIARIQKKFFNFLQGGYEKLEAVCFRHPKITILSGIAAVALGVLMFSRLNVQMMPMAARDFFVVEVYLDGNATLEDTKAVTDSLCGILKRDDRVESVTAFTGTGAPRFTATYPPKAPAPNIAQMIVNTKSMKDTEQLLQEYESRYEHHFPDAIVRFKQIDYQAVTAPVEIELSGASQEEMKPYADRIKAFMYTLDEELKWVHSDTDDYVSHIDVMLDQDEASRLGINKTMLSLSLAGAFDGQQIASVWEGDRQIPVTMYSDNVNPDMSYDVIGNQLVSTGVPGVHVPLRQVAEIRPDWRPSSITRDGGEETVTVYADMKFAKSHPVAMEKIDRFIEDEIRPELPEGVSIEYGGLSSVNGTVIPEILLSVLCAVMVLFLFMVFHFRKISLAILTLVLSLLCLFGASFGLWIFKLDFGMTAVLGFITLIGIIVRNGIIMFEYAEELRFSKGYDVKTAAEEAGKRRMRPIFLTSCTTALGVIPMILSQDSLWKPLGVVICFGTILSILLIVLIMPVSYWQLFRKARTVEPEE